MSPKTYSLEILTPQGRFFSGEVFHTLFPAEDGSVGVLADHTDYAASSPGGRLEIRLPSGETRRFRIGPGFFQARKNRSFLLAREASEA